jgi:phospholipase C
VTRRPRIPKLEPAERARAEREERELQTDPEESMRRREFLGRTAALAGAAGLASALPVEALVHEAAKKQTRASQLPSPSRMPIDTVVVVMMENRSFDHYFGWREDADGKQAGLVYPDKNLQPVATHHLGADFQGCAFDDPDHSWDGGRHQYNGGKMDGFVQGNAQGTGSDSYAADAFQLHDRFFCSTMASTYPNRHYMWGAQAGGQKSNVINPSLNTWENIFDRAGKNNVSASYFQTDVPFSSLYGSRGVLWTHPLSDYYSRAAAGTLSSINYVDPAFGGGVNGVSGDEHPHGDVRTGQAWMADVVNAFIESPQFRRGALFIVYDEWGGFFDHVPPRSVPDDRESKNIFENYGLTGFRIPAVTVSPYVRQGSVSHATCTFESILKLISYRFRLGFLNKRHRYAFNIGRTFDWANPDFDRPPLPNPVDVVSQACSGPRAQEIDRPKEHDMMELQTSGLLERYGYEYEPATPETLFRQPDSVMQGLRESTPWMD